MASKSKSEWLPWYRRKDYKGNLTEEEKRHLDGFRLLDRHPAATFEDLPGEVQSYISELELALYDKRQENVFNKAVVFTLVGGIFIYSAYHDIGSLHPILGYLIGAGLIAVGWVNYRREWRRNADALFIKQRGEGVPPSRAQRRSRRTGKCRRSVATETAEQSRTKPLNRTSRVRQLTKGTRDDNSRRSDARY